jgi:hypothetical protein
VLRADTNGLNLELEEILEISRFALDSHLARSWLSRPIAELQHSPSMVGILAEQHGLFLEEVQDDTPDWRFHPCFEFEN